LWSGNEQEIRTEWYRGWYQKWVEQEQDQGKDKGEDQVYTGKGGERKLERSIGCLQFKIDNGLGW